MGLDIVGEAISDQFGKKKGKKKKKKRTTDTDLAYDGQDMSPI